MYLLQYSKTFLVIKINTLKRLFKTKTNECFELFFVYAEVTIYERKLIDSSRTVFHFLNLITDNYSALSNCLYIYNKYLICR